MTKIKVNRRGTFLHRVSEANAYRTILSIFAFVLLGISNPLLRNISRKLGVPFLQVVRLGSLGKGESFLFHSFRRFVSCLLIGEGSTPAGAQHDNRIALGQPSYARLVELSGRGLMV